MIALAALLCLAGFAGLCLAMDRHHRAAFNRPPSPARRRALRTGGWLATGLALAAACRAWGVVDGVIGWLGLLSLGAAIVLLLRTYASKPPSRPQRDKP